MQGEAIDFNQFSDRSHGLFKDKPTDLLARAGFAGNGVVGNFGSGGRATSKLPIIRVVSMGRRNTQLRPTFNENKS
jgi:hypothetical protein